MEEAREVANWGPREVIYWLETKVKLPEEYRARFLAQDIDGAALLEGFSDQELEVGLGMELMGHRKRFQRELRALRW